MPAWILHKEKEGNIFFINIKLYPVTLTPQSYSQSQARLMFVTFHPIPCGSRDRPVGRKVIDEGKIMC